MNEHHQIQSHHHFHKLSQSQMSLPSSSIVAENDDLLTEILFRLPIKPLFRFKSVSKHWLSLISNPRFSHRKNLDVCKNVSSLYVHRQAFFRFRPEYDIVRLDNTTPERCLISCPNQQPLKILQSCNGLMLCCNGKYDHYIFNPTTNQFRRIPSPVNRVFEVRHGIESISAINIAFDPRKSPHYKLVCVYVSETTNSHYEMEIYSSETGVWTPIGCPFLAEVNFRTGVYWNGSVHWSSLGNDDGLYFNLDEERLGIMPMPPVPDGNEERRIRYFGASNDHLHIIEIYGPRTTQFDVYELDREYSRWSIRYRVDIEDVMNAFPETICGYLDPSDSHYYRFLILGFVQGLKDEETFLVLSIPGKAIRYNVWDKSFKRISDFESGESDFGAEPMFGWYDAFQYVECISDV